MPSSVTTTLPRLGLSLPAVTLASPLIDGEPQDIIWTISGLSYTNTQDVVLFEVGYFVRELRMTPVFQFTRRALVDTNAGDETRWSLGLNYWWARHNANVKAAYTRIDPRTGARQNELTIQLQVFYY